MATKANLKIDQGTDFATSITLTDDEDVPLNLVGYSGAGQIRKHYTSSTSYNFNVNVIAATGTVEISIDANTTNSMADGRYVYDIELTDNTGLVSRIMEGIVTITPGVTR